MQARRIVCAAFAIGSISCGNDGVGDYHVTWSITGADVASTCVDQGIEDVVVSVLNNAGATVTSVSVPCSEGGADLTDVAIGQHRLTFDLLGTFGEAAGSGEALATLTYDEDDVLVPRVEIDALPRQTDLDVQFVITEGGASSSCAGVEASGLALRIDDGVVNIYKCSTSHAQSIAFGPGMLEVELLTGVDDDVIATTTVELPATRGTLEVEVELAVD